jgi:hypothetical protein
VNAESASSGPQAVSVTLTVQQPPAPALITAFASFDNGLMASGRDQTLANKVLEKSELGVGCTFLYMFDGTFYDFLCLAAALKFDIQDQIRGRTIRKATLRLDVLHLRGDFLFGPEYKVLAFADSWNPNSLTWNVLETLRFQNPQLTMRAPNSAAPVDHDVTEMVQNWASGAGSNHGFLLYPIIPASGPGYNSIQATFFQSLEANKGSANRPKLIIEFE